jgi:hypothetical protein
VPEMCAMLILLGTNVVTTSWLLRPPPLSPNGETTSPNARYRSLEEETGGV